MITLGHHQLLMSKSAGDPFADDVVFLCHFDSTTGTALVDSSGTGKNFIRNGSSVLTTTAPLYGSQSLLLDGTSMCSASTGGLEYTNFVFGTGDFTLECSFRTNTVDGVLLEMRPPHQSGLVTYLNASGQIGIFTNVGGNIALEGSANLADNVKHDVAWCRASGVMRIFVDGVLVASGANAANLSNFPFYPLIVGSGNNNTARFVGRIDEVRITRAARYTSNYTPSLPFPNPP